MYGLTLSLENLHNCKRFFPALQVEHNKLNWNIEMNHTLDLFQLSVYNAVLEYTWSCFQASQQFMKSEVCCFMSQGSLKLNLWRKYYLKILSFYIDIL